MRWAFWQRGPSDAASDARAKRARSDDAPARTAPTTRLKVRARRRLIGAAALLLAVVVIVPMVLDPTPKPLPDNIPIDIPSEKTPFSPRLSLPTLPEPGAAPAEPPETKASPAAEGDDTKADAPTSDGVKASAPKATAEKAPEKGAERTADKAAKPPETAKRAAESVTEEARVRDLLEGRADKSGNAAAGKYVVQAAALGSEAAARELSERLKKAGFAPFTERVDVKDGVRYRVRVGPYATRDEAERARARLRAIGVGANVVTV
jgi:DedD protein